MRVVSALLALTLVTTGQLSQQAPTFRTGTDAVSVDVSVRDGTRAVTGLAAADFEVFDNDVAQQVTDVSYGKEPIDVTVALDVSMSVTGPLLDRLRRAVGQLVRDLGAADRLKLITFNMRISRVVDFTSDAAVVEQAVRATTAGGGSSVWDAIGVALVSASEPNRRQLVVLFSDGADTTSATDPDTLVSLAQRTNASLTSVVPTTPGPVSTGLLGLSGATVVRQGPMLVPSLLRQLATETGGRVLPIGIANVDLTSTFRRILDEFRSSYVLHFTPAGVERGGFHALRVAVKGRARLTILARRGYFW
jgi:VWFA-related protein